jgi:hypothetical protein
MAGIRPDPFRQEPRETLPGSFPPLPPGDSAATEIQFSIYAAGRLFKSAHRRHIIQNGELDVGLLYQAPNATR